MSDGRLPNMQRVPLVAGVDVGGTQIRAAILRGATLLSRVECSTGKNPTPSYVIPRICASIHQAFEKAHVKEEEVLGIGVGVAGELDSSRGVIFSSPNLPGWELFPLGTVLKEQFAIPIYIENDANVAALAEYELGAGRGYKDVVYLTVSTGIGGGVIIDGRLMGGASGTGGEIGHMTIDWHGGRCNCGNIGCLEYLASGTAIARLANEAISSGSGAELLAFAQMLEERDSADSRNGMASVQSSRDSLQQEHAGKKQLLQVDARIVALAAEANIPLARTIIMQAAEALGVGLVNIIQIFNPERIILGGGVAQMGTMLLEPAKRIAQQRPIKAFKDAVEIVEAQLGGDAGLIGAGILIYQKEKVSTSATMPCGQSRLFLTEG